VFSEKAYRREGGTFFEAIGNVVVSSGKETLYGEKASFNTKSGEIFLEGSVRYVGQSVTVYASKIEYNMESGKLIMANARMITPEFSIVSTEMVRKSNKLYHAKNAEFTTCRDCAESWLISGKEVWVEIDQYVQLYHALVKVKGVDVLYVPYIALPIKNKRESGLLFPRVSTRNIDGFHYEQPLFWNVSDSLDVTFTPLFLSQRGYGTNFQYRQVFDSQSWIELNNKLVNDEIYRPGEKNREKSGTSFFRHFFELENHQQWSERFSSHLKITGSKDNDFFRDYNYYTEQFLSRNDIGAEFMGDLRFDSVNWSVQADYKQNILAQDPVGFDDSYVQILPRIGLSTKPFILWELDSSYLYKFTWGLDSDLTVFKQNRRQEAGALRNAARLDVSPYVEMNLLNLGPTTIKSKYQVDFQEYDFLEEEQERFQKISGLVSTEMAFAIDRVYGLAYEESYQAQELKEEDRMKISQGEKKKKSLLSDSLIGKLPSLQNSLTQEKIVVKRNSYRHSQEFKVIHHQLVNSRENGNASFLNQIGDENGWFDYRDAITEDIYNLGSNETRTIIPPNNTVEFQWNNVLIKKTPKKFNFLDDERYLKDNFSYQKLGDFKVSQGYLLTPSEDVNNRLTRLLLETRYATSQWSFHFRDYYFHDGGDNILTFSGQRRFDKVSLLAQYNFNSFDNSNLKTLRSGLQFRPSDTFGFSLLSEQDLNANENISTIYQMDLMPLNNCWIFNFKYIESFIEQRYVINFDFNFGSEEFSNFKRNFFDFGRIVR
jgi:LPS-assembly protein